MSDSTDIFSLNTMTEEDSWAHGAATARAWLTGSLHAEDGLDASAEFDAQVSGRLGVEVAQALASVQAEASGVAHAGLRLQVGLPLDLFEGAGLVARLRAEASISGQVSVKVSLTAGALGTAVLDAVPDVARPYAELLLEELTVSAGVWGRGSFSVMATAELLSLISLFPSDGSAPGVTAHFRYGYGWLYGGGWGTVVNVGFDPDRIVDRLCGQISLDLAREIGKLTLSSGTGELEPWLLSICPTLVPAVLRLLVDIARLTMVDSSNVTLDSALGAFVVQVRPSVVSWLVDGLAKVASEALGAAGIPQLDEAARQVAWDAIDALTAARIDRRAETDVVLAAIKVAVDISNVLLASERDVVLPLVRCIAALTLLTGPRVSPDTLRGIFPDVGGDESQVDLVIRVLSAELEQVLIAHRVLPDWMTHLLGSTGDVLALILSDGATSVSENVSVVARLVHAVTTQVFPGGAWSTIMEQLPEDLRPAITGAVHVLDEFCADTTSTAETRGKVLREGLTVCLITLIGTPLAHIIETVANHGLRAVPGGFRDLADLVDQGNKIPPSLSWSWNQLAQAAVGITVGEPTALTLRKTAATIENWCDTVLPEELHFMTGSLKLRGVCEKIPIHGTAKALAEFRKNFLLDLAGHTARHVLASIEFSHREGLELVTTLTESLVKSVVRSIEVSAIAAFKAFEESIRIAESAATESQARADALERELAQKLAELTTGLRALGTAITNALDDVENQLVSHLLDSALRLGADRGVAMDILRTLVTAGINAVSGGITRGVRDFATSLARILNVAAEGLAATAASPNAPRGIRGILEGLNDAGAPPKVLVPIIVPIPNPFLPGILPDIQVKLFDIEIPSEIVGQLIITALFDVAGLGPLLDGLDMTVASVQATRIALDQTKALLDGEKTHEQRDALNRAAAFGPLAVTFTSPDAGSVTPAEGEITFRVDGVNRSFVQPEGAGLPESIPRRLVVRVNGRDVTDRVQWDADVRGLSGRLGFSSMAEGPATVFVSPPTCVSVAVTGGQLGGESVGATRVFVPPALPRSLVVECIVEAGHSHITMIGGSDSAGRRWSISMSDALQLHERGTRFYVRSQSGEIRPLVAVRSRAGRRYLRAGRGHGIRLNDLPRCK